MIRSNIQDKTIEAGIDIGSSEIRCSIAEINNHNESIALLGILPNNTKIDWDDVIFKGLKIKGIYGREMYETWHKMVQILRGGLNVKKILTHTFSVADYQEAFTILEIGKCGKVVLKW